MMDDQDHSKSQVIPYATTGGPRLVARREGTANESKPFVLRVPVAEVERGRRILSADVEDDAEKILQCPNCGGRQIEPVREGRGRHSPIVCRRRPVSDRPMRLRAMPARRPHGGV